MPLLSSLDINVERQGVGDFYIYYNRAVTDKHTQFSMTAVKV